MPRPTVGWNELGVQAHCLRREMAADFSGTLQRLKALGLARVELCSFPGCAGNPWGDFGPLAGQPPERIRDQLAEAGFEGVACHFNLRELTEASIATSVCWAKAVGSPVIVLAGFALTAQSCLADWQSAFEGLNRIGARLRAEGLRFAYHTQNDVWAKVEGRCVFDELLRLTDPELCAIELDLSGTLAFGTDWKVAVAAASGRLLALHLRDGKRPPGPVPWLPALALGEGDMDMGATIDAARRAGAQHYLLEMEVEPARDVFEALATSIGWLRAKGALENRA